jgi:hypothetical protein
VRVSTGVTFDVWRRFLDERLYGVARGSPALRAVAAHLRAPGGDAAAVAERIVRWICDNIEPEGDIAEAATSTLARGRGNREGLALALAREAGVPAELILVRPLTVAPAAAPVVAQEVGEFSEVLVRFGRPGDPASRLVDLRLRRAPVGYLAPSLDGALGVAAASGARGPVRGTVRDARAVEIDLDLDLDGRAHGRARERLSGGPALEWRELVEQTAGDPGRLRQEFEQRWLAPHFPGAELLELDVAAAGRAGDRAETAPAPPAQAEIRYTFAVPMLGMRSGRELHVSPTFFLSQLGRRYATEGTRRTALLLDAEVPLDVEARFTLPPGVRQLDLGPIVDVRAGPGGEIRFLERREALPAIGRGGLRVRLRRQVRLPALRIDPRAYGALAAELRRVDPAEEAEMRFGLP